jgi:hypothetical protein
VAVRSRELYRSPNGDSWHLVVDSQSGRVSVKHEANIPSGGHAEDVDLGRFLVEGGLGPEKQELLRLIASLVDAPPER